MAENTTQKVVTLEALEAASALIATKAEVAKAGSVTYATTEEVLALFQETAPTE